MNKIISFFKNTGNKIKSGVQTYLNIKKIIAFFATPVGYIVFWIIIVLLIMLLVYITAKVAIIDIEKIFGINDAGLKNSQDYEYVKSLLASGYEDLLPADELAEYYNFEYACLMDVARYIEETGVYEVDTQNNSPFDVSEMGVLAQYILSNPSSASTALGTNTPLPGLSSNTTAGDYSRWIWALMNTHKDPVARGQVRAALESAISGIRNGTIGGGAAGTAGTGGNANGGNAAPAGASSGDSGDKPSNEFSKHELYYEKVTSEITGETSLVPYLLIHRDWDRLKYRFYDLDEQNQLDPAASLAAANVNATYIYENIYALHANGDLNANNVALRAGAGHNIGGVTSQLDLNASYPATLFYDTSAVAPATYRIPLKVLINRYLPKATLLTAWALAKDETKDVDTLLNDIKKIYNEACMKDEEISGDKILVKNLSYVEDLQITEARRLGTQVWKETSTLPKYLDGTSTNVILSGYAPLFDVRTLSATANPPATPQQGAQTGTQQGGQTGGQGSSQEDPLDGTLKKVLIESTEVQTFGETDLYDDIYDDIKLALAQHQANNLNIKVGADYTFVKNDIERELREVVDEWKSHIQTSMEYTDEIVIYRKNNATDYRIECIKMLSRATHHDESWKTKESGKLHVKGNNVAQHEFYKDECKEYIENEHGNPYDETNPMLDCFVPYMKIAIKAEKSSGNVRLRSTAILIFEPSRDGWSQNPRRITQITGYGYRIMQSEIGDVTNNQTFVTFERGLAEQSTPLYSNWYSLGDTQELYVVDELMEVQGFMIPNQVSITVSGYLKKNKHDALTDDEIKALEQRASTRVYITVDDNLKQTIMDICLTYSNYGSSAQIITGDSLVITRPADANGNYDLTPPNNAAPTTAIHLDYGPGESTYAGEMVYVKLDPAIGDLVFTDTGKITSEITSLLRTEALSKARQKWNVGKNKDTSPEYTVKILAPSYSGVSSSMVPTVQQKLAMFTVLQRMCTIGTDVDFITMPIYLPRRATTWSSVKNFSNTFVLNGKAIEKDNYLYLIQAQRFNNGLADIQISTSANWRTRLFAPIFKKGTREKDITLMLSEWIDVGNASKEGSYAYTYVRDLYKLINYSKGISDIEMSTGERVWRINPIKDENGKAYVHEKSYEFLNIEDEILMFDETISDKAYWLDRLMATMGADKVTYQENLEMRNAMELMTWQIVEYEKYPECISGDEYQELPLAYALWPFGGTLGRSLITFNAGSNQGFRNLLSYGVYQGVGLHGGSDWNGRNNADRIYESVYGKPYDYKNPLPDDAIPAITTEITPMGTVKLNIDTNMELGEDGKLAVRELGSLYSGPITINLEGEEYTFKSAASAVYGYELYRLTLKYKSPERARIYLKHQLEEEILNTPIVSPAPGYVESIGASSTGGFGVAIAHSDGSRISMVHMKRYPIVQVGQYVGAGTILGYEGTTGNSGGYHSHVEIAKDNLRNQYGIPFMYPLFTPFYYAEKTIANDGGGRLPIGSDYLSLERTGYPVRLQTEEFLEDPLINNTLESAATARGITYVNGIDSANGEIEIKNYTPTQYLEKASLLYNETTRKPSYAMNKSEQKLPISSFTPLRGSDYIGKSVETLEIYFDSDFIDKVLEEEGVMEIIAKYIEEEEAITVNYSNGGDFGS